MSGKLIVLEGIDGSGKSTQFDMLCKRLDEAGRDYMRVVFPQYSEPSSALIRMYLGGEFGKNPSDVNAYAASSFYAVDRYASYVKVWRDYYLDGGLVLCDRYTTSNAIHQASKLAPESRSEFFAWLEDFEYGKMSLPRPDRVMYMDITLEAARENIRLRDLESGKMGDIHETDCDYLSRCLSSAKMASEYYNWHSVSCVDQGGKMRPSEEIHRDVLRAVFPEAMT